MSAAWACRQRYPVAPRRLEHGPVHLRLASGRCAAVQANMLPSSYLWYVPSATSGSLSTHLGQRPRSLARLQARRSAAPRWSALVLPHRFRGSPLAVCHHRDCTFSHTPFLHARRPLPHAARRAHGHDHHRNGSTRKHERSAISEKGAPHGGLRGKHRSDRQRSRHIRFHRRRCQCQLAHWCRTSKVHTMPQQSQSRQGARHE